MEDNLEEFTELNELTDGLDAIASFEESRFSLYDFATDKMIAHNKTSYEIALSLAAMRGASLHVMRQEDRTLALVEKDASTKEIKCYLPCTIDNLMSETIKVKYVQARLKENLSLYLFSNDPSLKEIDRIHKTAKMYAESTVKALYSRQKQEMAELESELDKTERSLRDVYRQLTNLKKENATLLIKLKQAEDDTRTRRARRDKKPKAKRV